MKNDHWAVVTSPRWFAAFLMLLSSWAFIHCDSSQSMTLEMTGEGYEWFIRYPGQDRILNSDDDVVAKKDLVVPANTQLTIFLTSHDYIYTLKIPDFEQSKMGVPEITFDMKFFSGKPGNYPLDGDQMCGFTHETLQGRLIVLERADFNAWQKEIVKQSFDKVLSQSKH